MAAKVVLFCAQVLLVQYISCQCISNAFNGGFGWEAPGAPWGGPGPYAAAGPYAATWAGAPCAATPYATAEWAGFIPAASNGGGFPVTSASPIIPTGVSMTSENAYEGPLAVSGAVPFLGAIALEGVLPTAGAGGVTYGCGNGNVAMVSEDIAPTYGGAYGYGPGIMAADYGYGYPGLGYEAAIAGPGYGYGYNRGCGCGAIY